MAPTPAGLSELLDAALALPPAERLAWIETLGAEHDALKPRLRALLARSLAPTRADELDTLPKVADAGTATDATSPELARFDETNHTAGSTIGRYVLVRKLGLGAMGVVWLAELPAHDGTPARHVALKFAHMAQKRTDLTLRLARERGLLAVLDHPNIARLFDAGVTPEGQPYLVLEYIAGVPLDEYCHAAQPSLPERLALFVQIASAVAHAHEHRIVHRDLKPANVLVTQDVRAHLLDFGIGKLLAGDVPPILQLTLFTGQPLTPAYASPEQLRGEEAGFASDIYTLGVLLYELLTGSRPYICKPGSNRALREAILVTKPLAPSAVVQDRALRRRLTGTLDAIALHALDKKPERRHASAQLLAAEVAQALAALS